MVSTKLDIHRINLERIIEISIFISYGRDSKSSCLGSRIESKSLRDAIKARKKIETYYLGGATFSQRSCRL